MVEYNVERKHLSEAMKITPGKVQELLSYDTVESHGYPPGTIYCERPFGVGWGGGGGDYTLWLKHRQSKLQ